MTKEEFDRKLREIGLKLSANSYRFATIINDDGDIVMIIHFDASIEIHDYDSYGKLTLNEKARLLIIVADFFVNQGGEQDEL